MMKFRNARRFFFNSIAFLMELVNCCFCLECLRCVKRCLRGCIACYSCGLLKAKKKVRVPKPESMADVPDSHSDEDDSEVDDAYRGLENAAIFLGEGPVLYLQIAKTFMWMFVFLCLVNLPAFLVLPRLSEHN